jgi:hypothetical protein
LTQSSPEHIFGDIPKKQKIIGENELVKKTYSEQLKEETFLTGPDQYM